MVFEVSEQRRWKRWDSIPPLPTPSRLGYEICLRFSQKRHSVCIFSERNSYSRFRNFATCTVLCYWLQEVWKQGVRVGRNVKYRKKIFVEIGQSVGVIKWERQTELWPYYAIWVLLEEAKSAKKKWNMRNKTREPQLKFVIKFYVVGFRC